MGYLSRLKVASEKLRGNCLTTLTMFNHMVQDATMKNVLALACILVPLHANAGGQESRWNAMVREVERLPGVTYRTVCGVDHCEHYMNFKGADGVRRSLVRAEQGNSENLFFCKRDVCQKVK